ncbi:MAG: hypothetical protein ACRDRY_20770 [Pseudonocardiaceae bacterium]
MTSVTTAPNLPACFVGSPPRSHSSDAPRRLPAGDRRGRVGVEQGRVLRPGTEPAPVVHGIDIDVGAG